MATTPKKITLRAYPVGFGDCFLMTLHYPSRERHLLIDFGSTSARKGAPKDVLAVIAKDIAARCGGKLDVVVATHRHKDHVSGFATNKAGTGPGDIIAACKPEVVIQPWTEDPRAARGARAPTGGTSLRAFVQSLAGMQEAAAGIRAEALALGAKRGPGLRIGKNLVGELAFLGEDGIGNRSAVENLMRMGKRREYAFYGKNLKLGGLLPGVKVRVLGPPTLKQSKEISKQRARDSGEFWHLQGLSARAFTQAGKGPFPRGAQHAGPLPPAARWLRRKLLPLRAQQLLQIVRILDDAMNNTSLILFFEVGGYSLLFPGDAQIENWTYALEGAPDSAEIRKLLAGVNLYKVGHHGSLNATPKKKLWNLFRHRSKRATAKGRLQTVMSTLPGKHGAATRGTEVPRRILVDELASQSDYFTTESLRPSKADPQVLEIDVATGKVTATPKKR